MTRTSEKDYYLARIVAEREAAQRATSEAARRAHIELAEHYQQLLQARGGAANER